MHANLCLSYISPSLSRLILGYHDTRDKISLYTKGSGGVDELRANLKDEVLYGFVRIDNHYALLAYVSEHVRYVFLHHWLLRLVFCATRP